MIGVGVNTGSSIRKMKVGPGFDPATITLLNRFDVEPTAALKSLIDTTILGLKADGVFALGDCMYIRGMHTAQAACQNWIKDDHNSTLVNSPTFTEKVGFTGSATAYIKNDWLPNTDKVNYSLTAASIFIWTKTLATANSYLLGSISGAGNIYFRFYSAGNERVAINFNSYANNYSVSAEDFWGYIRDGDYQQGYINGLKSGANSSKLAVSPISDLENCELGYNQLGTFYSGAYDGTISASFYGGGLTEPQALALYTRIKYFNDNVAATF